MNFNSLGELIIKFQVNQIIMDAITGDSSAHRKKAPTKNWTEKEIEEENTEIKREKISALIKNSLIDLFIESVTLLFICRCKKTFNINKTKETFDFSNLTNEEKYVFYGNKEREYRINIVLNTLFEGKPRTLEKIVSSIF